MTGHPARGRAGSLIGLAAAVLTAASCGWGTDIGTGSRADGDRDTGVATDGARPATGAGDPRNVVVERVVDGDSVELTAGGMAVELRLEGYNAPELFIENANGADARSCNGLAAREALATAIETSSTIELIEGGTDRFGRTLGDLVVDGESVVDRLIRGGFGLATGDDEGRRARMVEAASAGLAMWGADCGDPGSDALAIGAIQVDAPGDDRENLSEEYVEVANTGSETVDLSGWVLRDDTTSHQFPLAGSLAAGELLTVVTGGSTGGAVQPGTLHLGESFPVWSNDWETVILVDPDGVFADWRFIADGRVVVD